jgi:hypothetical protein
MRITAAGVSGITAVAILFNLFSWSFLCRSFVSFISQLGFERFGCHEKGR